MEFYFDYSTNTFGLDFVSSTFVKNPSRLYVPINDENETYIAQACSMFHGSRLTITTKNKFDYFVTKYLNELTHIMKTYYNIDNNKYNNNNIIKEQYEINHRIFDYNIVETTIKLVDNIGFISLYHVSQDTNEYVLK
jgi:hypothetical protein